MGRGSPLNAQHACHPLGCQKRVPGFSRRCALTDAVSIVLHRIVGSDGVLGVASRSSGFCNCEACSVPRWSVILSEEAHLDKLNSVVERCTWRDSRRYLEKPIRPT
jgi:hypothetical protein